MSSEAEPLPPYHLVWRKAAEIRRYWSKQTRANRRRYAKTRLRRIGLDESLLPPIPEEPPLPPPGHPPPSPVESQLPDAAGRGKR